MNKKSGRCTEKVKDLKEVKELVSRVSKGRAAQEERVGGVQTYM